MVLAQHDLLGVGRPVCGVVMLRDDLGESGCMLGTETGIERVAHPALGEIVQPVGDFHDVGVGVVNDAASDIGHRGPSYSVRQTLGILYA